MPCENAANINLLTYHNLRTNQVILRLGSENNFLIAPKNSYDSWINSLGVMSLSGHDTVMYGLLQENKFEDW